MDQNDQYDFSGYASKAGVKCSDGRTILPNAFKHNDGARVPLVWQHCHDGIENILGHAILENRPDGVYAYGRFNQTPQGQTAKALVEAGDILSLSIYANSLVEKAKVVSHGEIREVSLVIAGANPESRIEHLVIKHSDSDFSDVPDEAVIFSGEMVHAAGEDDPEVDEEEDNKDSSDKTLKDIFDSLTEEQKNLLYVMVAENTPEQPTDETEMSQSNIIPEETAVMKTNVFDTATTISARPVLTHDQFSTIVETARKNGSFKDAFLAHAGTFGIDNIDVLFPDAKAESMQPVFVQRDQTWVSILLDGVRKSRFSRLKSLSADITVETARAKGYVKGALKKDEVFALLHRTTSPTTIYKKQKLDRDDILDITDLNVVAWLKEEMRVMLREELARAILLSDGRAVDDEDKIPEANIRPIAKDADMYVHRVRVAADATEDEIMDAVVRARSEYEGSGSPIMFTTADVLTDLILQRDTTKRRLYNTEQELASALRVSQIVEVPVMEDQTREVTEGAVTIELALLAVIVNPRDYTLGADNGGEESFFEDFDIDYNQQKYLLETRRSGALMAPKTAIIVEQIVEAEG